MRKFPGIFCSLLFGLATSAAAQQPSPVSGPPPAATTFEIAALTPEQDGQLAAWLTGMAKWQQYDEKWRNRPVHDYWERIVERKPPPSPPDWLPPQCQSIAAAEMTGFDASILLEETETRGALSNPTDATTKSAAGISTSRPSKCSIDASRVRRRGGLAASSVAPSVSSA